MGGQSVRLFFLLSVFLVFCGSVSSYDEPARSEAKTLEIKNVRLVTWRVAEQKRKDSEVERFSEIAPRQLIPSNKFDVECEIVEREDDHFSDYLVWATVDFLVSPVTRAYEQIGQGALSSSVGWGQMAEMRDLKATTINRLRPGESRKVALKGMDLSPVLSTFPVGEEGELWPWLIRVVVHVQDRSGKQLTSAERILRLVPSSARKKSHYNAPLPPR
jgi:hypothetical protein